MAARGFHPKLLRDPDKLRQALDRNLQDQGFLDAARRQTGAGLATE
jgi:hypothetical protein